MPATLALRACRRTAVSLRPAWMTEQVLDQTGTYFPKTNKKVQPTQHTNAKGLAVPSVALGSAEVSSRAEQTCQFPSPSPVIKVLVSGAHILYFNKLKV